MKTMVIDKMVDRFLAWSLPKDFAPDGGISFNKYYHGADNGLHPHEPIGTNLLTAEQARQMFEHVLDDAPEKTMGDYPQERCDAVSKACMDALSQEQHGLVPELGDEMAVVPRKRLAILESVLDAWLESAGSPAKTRNNREMTWSSFVTIVVARGDVPMDIREAGMHLLEEMNVNFELASALVERIFDDERNRVGTSKDGGGL